VPTEPTPLLRYCLDTTAVRLAGEFHGVLSPETVRRYVEEAYGQIGDRRTVGPNFLPVIIERFAREQLWAIAQATGAVDKPLPEVLFVCERNAGRSQMAACLAHGLSKGWIGFARPARSPTSRSTQWSCRRWRRSAST
jgi:arsenate reductase